MKEAIEIILSVVLLAVFIMQALILTEKKSGTNPEENKNKKDA